MDKILSTESYQEENVQMAKKIATRYFHWIRIYKVPPWCNQGYQGPCPSSLHRNVYQRQKDKKDNILAAVLTG